MGHRTRPLVFLFLLTTAVALHGGVAGGTDTTGSPAPDSLWTPPPCTGLFTDVPCSGTGSQFAEWIEQFNRDGITSGCATGLYCPDNPVTRRQMAVFVERGMRGTASWPPHTALVFHRAAAEASSDLSSGADLLAIVAAIPTSGAEAPSATNPWLVKVGPGVYDLGAGPLALPNYTALEGAGQGVTVITATGYADLLHGTVMTGIAGMLSRLTVKNTGGAFYTTAVYIHSNMVTLEHMTAVATSSIFGVGRTYAVYADSTSSLRAVDCDLEASDAEGNIGVMTTGTAGNNALRFENVRFNVHGSQSTAISYGLWSDNASPYIAGSRFRVQGNGGLYGLYVSGTGQTLDLRDSLVYTQGAGAGAGVYAHLGATLQGVTIDSEGGDGLDVGGTGVVVRVNGCDIEGAANWLDIGPGATVNVGASRLIGVTNGSGTTHCYGNYTGSGFLTNTCP